MRLLGVTGLRLLVTFLGLVLDCLRLLDLPRALPLPLPRPRPDGRLLLLRLGAIARVGLLRLQQKLLGTPPPEMNRLGA